MSTLKDDVLGVEYQIDWPIYKDYAIIPLTEYIRLMEHASGKELFPSTRSFLQKQFEKPEYIYVIFPTTADIRKTYNPIHTKQSNFKKGSFFTLTKITPPIHTMLKEGIDPTTRVKMVHKQILNWVNQYGLPFHTATPPDRMSFSPATQNLRRSYDVEKELEMRWGCYAMLNTTFLGLAAEARIACSIVTPRSSSSFPPMDFSDDALQNNVLISDPSLPVSRIGAERNHSSRKEAKSELEENLRKTFEQLILYYCSRVKLGLKFQEIQEINGASSFQYERTFSIPDLLTAIWYNFYTELLVFKRLKVCQGCGCLFAQTRANQKYCPTSDTVNPCKNKFNVRRSRQRKKERTAE